MAKPNPNRNVSQMNRRQSPRSRSSSACESVSWGAAIGRSYPKPHCRRRNASGCLELLENLRGVEKRFALLVSDEKKELALEAIGAFCCERPLNHSSAQGAGQRPARSATVLAAVHAVNGRRGCRKTHAKLPRFSSAGLSPALLEFPAIHSSHPYLLVWIPNPGL